MELPKQLHVYGRNIPVNLAKHDEHAGMFCKEEYKIYITPDQTEHEKWTTLLHEMFHAVVHRCSIYQALDDNLEEIIVDSFATAIWENFELKPKIQEHSQSQNETAS